MSRSYKKTPVHKDLIKGSKNWANRKVRHNRDFDVSGGAYKRVYNQYDISDFHFRASLEEHMHWYENLRHVHRGEGLTPQERKDAINEWYKWYYRK